MKKCPTCERQVQWQDNPYRPFCSERCQLVDLGKWVSEEYRVPGRAIVTDEEGEGSREDSAEGNSGT
ncbi:MAG TPA: DNA gyrase inhibitor YacG [Pyrinomonadaceae bacterium]|jgi:endogenous inhibitor of DNA gyrase (YacG/DUF329 family)|nr:DNA gyrase inhibitor YacG [Pyrinomonadaceae bacterium]